jgi:hypothetical protein
MPIAFLLNLAGAVVLYELVEKRAHTFLMTRYKARFNKPQRVSLLT